MTTRPLDCEKALVSCCVTLHHMRKLIDKAENTNFIPSHLKAAMPGALAAVNAFLKGMVTAPELVRQESLPYLLEWQSRYRLPVGGILRGIFLPGHSSGVCDLGVSGHIVAAQIYDWPLGCRRVVELTLVNAVLTYKGVEFSFHEQPAGLAQELSSALRQLTEYRFIEESVLAHPDTAPEPALKVRVGIRASDRNDFWMRTNFKLA